MKENAVSKKARKTIVKQPVVEEQDDDFQSDEGDDGFDDMEEIPLDITHALVAEAKPKSGKPTPKATGKKV